MKIYIDILGWSPVAPPVNYFNYYSNLLYCTKNQKLTLQCAQNGDSIHKL